MMEEEEEKKKERRRTEGRRGTWVALEEMNVLCEAQDTSISNLSFGSVQAPCVSVPRRAICTVNVVEDSDMHRRTRGAFQHLSLELNSQLSLAANTLSGVPAVSVSVAVLISIVECA